MRYIAIEEAFSIPEMAERQSSPWPPNRFSRLHLADWARRLPDFTEHRIPEMDAAGIDIQVLSLTVPGLQAGLGAPAARDDARFANDYLARVVAEHPDRFRGFAALPMQDPAAVAAELGRCVRQLGLCGALVNDHLQGHYLDEPRYDQVWAALEELSVPLYLHPGAPSADRWKVLDGRPELYGATWSWAAETGGHALRVIYSGVFDRHPGGQADPRAHGRVLAVHAQPAGLSLGHPRSAGSAAAAAVGLHRLQRGDHHQRRVLPRRAHRRRGRPVLRRLPV
jgi:2,3-dihydroxybenzoate decarboxylase